MALYEKGQVPAMAPPGPEGPRVVQMGFRDGRPEWKTPCWGVGGRVGGRGGRALFLKKESGLVWFQGKPEGEPAQNGAPIPMLVQTSPLWLPLKHEFPFGLMFEDVFATAKKRRPTDLGLGMVMVGFQTTSARFPEVTMTTGSQELDPGTYVK